MSDKKEEYHSGMFSDMTISELKDKMVRLWKEIKSLEAEKKDYVKSISDTIKELKSQIDSTVYWIGIKTTEAEKLAIADSVSKDMGDE